MNIAKLLVVARSFIALLLGDWMTNAALSGVTAVEKHELSKTDFEIIDDAFNVLLQYRPDPVIVELRNMFRDAHTGWLEIEKEAA